MQRLLWGWLGSEQLYHRVPPPAQFCLLLVFPSVWTFAGVHLLVWLSYVIGLLPWDVGQGCATSTPDPSRGSICLTTGG